MATADIVDENDLKPFAEHRRGALHRVELDVGLVWIEQPVELGSAGPHPSRHFDLRELVLLHGLLNLPCQDSLDRHLGGFLEHSLLFEKAVETGARMFLAHTNFSLPGGP